MYKPWITIIGINQDDISTLNKLALKALFEAEIIFGAKRHLNLFNNFKKKCKILPVPIKKTFQKLKNNQGKKIVILVSGNAFWFGLGSLISRQFNRDEWQCFQAPSSFSLASAEMGWRMEDVMFFGLHAKKLEVIRASIAPNIKFIILLRDGNSVKKLTNFFTENGFGDSKFTIFESLGYKNFKKKNTVAKNNNFINLKHPLCVAIETRGNGLVIPSNSGIPDLFFANDGQITKQYIRSITLSALSPMPYKHLWDLGSGSGSIAVEWLLSEKTTTVSAVEKNKKRVDFITANCDKFGLDRMSIFTGDIDKVFKKLKKPDVIFIGGGLNEKLFKKIWNFIPKNTRIVVNGVTIETESCITNLFNNFGGSLKKIELSDIKPVGRTNVWSNKYPIVQWKIIK